MGARNGVAMGREIRQDTGGKPGRKPWGLLVLALLDDVAVIVLLFVVLMALDVELSIWMIIIIGLIAGTFIFIGHHALMSSLRRKKLTGQEGMLGETGTVTETLQPRGTVQVNGEYWKAESPDGTIQEGEDVEIVALRGLNLEVRKKV